MGKNAYRDIPIWVKKLVEKRVLGTRAGLPLYLVFPSFFDFGQGHQKIGKIILIDKLNANFQR